MGLREFLCRQIFRSAIEAESMMQTSWQQSEIRSLPLESLDERLRRYRLNVPEAVRVMEASLRRYGQISPVVICLREETPVLIDGFKRLSAARSLRGLSTLSARLIEADDRSAKAAIYGLNRVGRQPQELEEAWIVQALVREDGLSQVAVAELLGRHKSWVCRRLALLEKLCEAARQDLQLGLLSPTMARQLVRLPEGNQAEALVAARRESLTSEELRGVVDLLSASGTREKMAFVLEKPRQALRQAEGATIRSWDPRLSSAGNRANKQLGSLLDQLARMENWLHHRGRGELALCDRKILRESFERLVRQSRVVAELSEDFVAEISVP
ncbi:MAG: ParB N-terminal domain-containing protein [Deltaproteobacteria bacterium]|nr:ParB N-terminal domain-containing protein [Deltaproteobacteria bacterium]